MSEVVHGAQDHASQFDADLSASSQTFADRGRAWGGERKQISLGAAVVLALGASVATGIYLRRRATARMSRLVWLALTVRSMRAAMPPARTTAPLGGASGAALLAAIMVARARHARTRSGLDQLSDRLAALEAETASRLTHDRPRGRDVAFGAVAGLGLAGLVSRLKR